MNIILLISFFFYGFHFLDKDCKLEDGLYKTIYDEEYSRYTPFEFEVKNQVLTELNSNTSYLIQTLQKNRFSIESLEKNQDTLTDMQKALTSHGKPYYEIKSCNDDTLQFVMRVNLHIISHSGKFVRVK